MAFSTFFRDDVRLDAVSHFIFGAAVEQVGRVCLLVKFGDSMSIRSRDIRAAQFVIDDERRHRPTDPITTGSVGRRHSCVRSLVCQSVTE